jgi:hypothetical protein
LRWDVLGRLSFFSALASATLATVRVLVQAF